MEKNLKIFCVILAIIIGIFSVFIIEESVRLSNVKGAKPLIILGQTKCSPSCAEIGDEIALNYYGVGYKLTIKYYHSPESSQDNDVYKITGEEFRLFNNILLWAWVE